MFLCGMKLTFYVIWTAAARAISILNFTPVNGKSIRIMYSHRDPSIRKSGTANIFIKVKYYIYICWLIVISNCLVEFCIFDLYLMNNESKIHSNFAQSLTSKTAAFYGILVGCW